MGEKNIGIDSELLKSTFDKQWVEELYGITQKYIEKNLSKFGTPFFRDLGNYVGRNDTTLSPDLSDHFQRLLYAPNITVLDFVVKNYEEMKNLTFIDNGAGLGLLSIFLKKLNINCYNYDNHSQMGKCTLHREVFNTLSLDVQPVVGTVKPTKVDVLTSCGIRITHPALLGLDLKYALIDKSWVGSEEGWKNRNNIFPDIKEKNEFIILKEYEDLVVYGKEVLIA